MTTSSNNKQKKKTASAVASAKAKVQKKTSETTVETMTKSQESKREIITVNRVAIFDVQPSLFEPLEETLNLSPKEKDKLRTVLRTIDTGESWALKQALTLMTFNFFTPSKDPDHEVKVVTTPDFELTFTPSIYGSPTMYDADILMYVVSVLAADIRRHKNELTKSGTMPYKGVVIFQLRDFANRIGRSRNARSIQQLKESLDRLSMSSISIEKTGKIGNKEVRAGQTIGRFLEHYKFCEIREEGKRSVSAVQVQLADWLVRDIAEGRTLLFPDEYFELTPFEKSLFMVARSLVGLRASMFEKRNDKYLLTSEEMDSEPDANQPGMSFGNTKIEFFFDHLTLPELLDRMQYKQPLKKLKASLLEIIREGKFPAYEIALDERKRALSKHVVYFFRKDDKLKSNLFAAGIKYPGFKETYESLTTRKKLLEKDAEPKRSKKRKTSTAKSSAVKKAKGVTQEQSEDLSPESIFVQEVEAFMADENGES